MFGLFRGKADPQELTRRFLQTYEGRTLIIHAGLDMAWLEELLRQPGGAGHFRIDLRRPPGRRPTPVEWLAHEQIRPLGLPLPLLVKVTPGILFLRHLTRGKGLVEPGEILWLLDEIEQRYHALLRSAGDGSFQVSYGIALSDNEAEAMLAGLE